ncbi:ABC transporter ATP-binding protein [Frigidibacter sp. ROC022]|uniref:ABC transporter ATP-binding protein n=1 Tax=Frigidibacter sp. ROC022 TaxID=2971796 RepID=UPI00215B55FC|nr:ABC transporter ATP-binding protein [Frigidibacter sp. ROC022]MCR8725388.1 ABC transporter ATP-binding protein [Frigidibacter sp. ROC022]
MALQLEALSKSYGTVEVLRPIDLEIKDGEFLTLLGPSGSGKTTILRMIGGFTQPSGGRILLDGQDLARVPTNKRPFNTVFQDYALFPHMSVAKNVGYGLSIRRMPKDEIARAVQEALDTVGLGSFHDRSPAELSGGQRQRVALARAIVCRPRIVLLDEPLSALDAALRRQMQGFLKDLQRQIGTTFLFVTHDQQEALTMSDRMVVMNVGSVEQIGSPKDIYYRPRTRFVASFIGDNNLCEADIDADGRLVTPMGATARPDGVEAAPRRVLMAVRPELISLSPRDNALETEAEVLSVEFAGAGSDMTLRLPGIETPFTARITSEPGQTPPAPGARQSIWIRRDDIAVVEKAAEQAP